MCVCVCVCMYVRRVCVCVCASVCVDGVSYAVRPLTIYVYIYMYLYIYVCMCICMMMIAFITFNSSLVPLIEGLCSPNPSEFEFSGFRRNRTDDLVINSPSLIQAFARKGGFENLSASTSRKRAGLSFFLSVHVDDYD